MVSSTGSLLPTMSKMDMCKVRHSKIMKCDFPHTYNEKR